MNRDTCGTCGAPIELCKCAALGALTETHKELERALEYELWGKLIGCYGGRWTMAAIDSAAVYPPGTALYVRRAKE